MNDERIRKVMAQAFECPIEKITTSSNQNNVENWDSIHHTHLIVFLEREFNITIPDDVVGNMISFELIKTIVDEHTKSQISVTNPR